MKDDDRSEWKELVEIAMESKRSKQEFQKWLELRGKEEAIKRRKTFHVVKQEDSEDTM